MAEVKFEYRSNRVLNPSVFKTHVMQTYLALFMSKPELYLTEMTATPVALKQEKFFYLFMKMIKNYVNFNYEKEDDYETLSYFGSLQIDKAGSVNVAGGGGSRSNSGTKYLIGQYKMGQEANKKRVEYLTKKYGIKINNMVDEREFLGYKEIWNIASPELVTAEWKDQLEKGYDDMTLESMIPRRLNSALVPLVIRNKVVQKWQKADKDEMERLMEEAKKRQRLEEEEEENYGVKKVEVATALKVNVEGIDVDDW